MKKLVQLKIVHHKVSAMLYSVQNFKIRAAEGQYFIIGVSCISNFLEYIWWAIGSNKEFDTIVERGFTIITLEICNIDGFCTYKSASLNLDVQYYSIVNRASKNQ